MSRTGEDLRKPRAAPARASGSLLLLCLALLTPGLRADAGGGGNVLVPRVDQQWDLELARAAEDIRRGDFRTAILILQGIVDNTECRRALKAVEPEAPGGAAPGGGRAADEEPGPLDDPTRPGNPGEVDEIEEPARGAPRVRNRAPAARYLPVAAVARGMLAGLPPQGLSVYRKLYGELARGVLARALRLGDLDRLERVADDYFLTEAGSEARERLGEARFEEGRLWTALAHFRALGREGAGITLEVRLKMLKALRLLGSSEEYDVERRGFLAALRSAAGAGGASGAGESLHARLREFEAAHSFPAGTSGVAVAPGLAAAGLPRLPGRRLGFDWNSPFWAKRTVVRYDPRVRGPRAGRFGVPDERAAPVFPFFPGFVGGDDGGWVYLNGVSSLQGLSAATGKLVREYQRGAMNFSERGDSAVYTVAILPPAARPGDAPGGEGPRGVVIASYLSDLVRSQYYMGYEITAEIPTRSLIAFDCDSRALLWRTGQLTLGGSKPVSFTTPVLAGRGCIYAGGWQQYGYLDGVLVALERRSGRVLWHQLIASSQMEGTMFGELAREPLAAALAEREGVIFVPTNLGALAAVDAASGLILWAATYDSIAVRPALGPRSELRDIVWGVNPPLLIGEMVIVTPRDSYNLYALDASVPVPPHAVSTPPGPGPSPPEGAVRRGPGRILWKYANPSGDLRDLLGYSSATGYLYFTGPRGVAALDIRDAHRREPRLIRGPLQKSLEGRGALTDQGVVVASASGPLTAEGENRLWLVDLELKSCVDLTGPLPRSDLGSHGGNVSVALDRVFLTSRELVAAFSARPEPAPAPPPGAPAAERTGGEDL